MPVPPDRHCPLTWPRNSAGHYESLLERTEVPADCKDMNSKPSWERAKDFRAQMKELQRNKAKEGNDEPAIIGEADSVSRPNKRKRGPLPPGSGIAEARQVLSGVYANIHKEDAQGKLHYDNYALASQSQIESVANRWKDWLDTNPLKGRDNPDLLECKEFVSSLLTSNKQSSDRLGIKQETMRKYVHWMREAIFPQLYKAHFGGNANQLLFWRKLKNHVNWLFSPGGILEVGQRITAARGVEYAEKLMEEMRVVTSEVCTRRHASEEDLEIIQDILFTQIYNVSLTLVLDAYLAVVQQCALRPSSVMCTAEDKDDPLAQFHNRSPLCLGQVTISRHVLNSGQGRQIGDFPNSLVITLETATNKFNRHKDYHYACNLTADSCVMIRCSNNRLLRYLVSRGVFKGQHVVDSVGVGRLVASPEFRGVTPALCGFTSMEAMLRSCEEWKWAWFHSTVKMWPLFAIVDTTSGIITNRESLSSGSAAQKLSEVGHDAGMMPGAWGAWSPRKRACDKQVAGGREEIASRLLQHRSITSSSLNSVYKKSLQGIDLGAAAWPEEVPLPLADPLSLSRWRVPKSRIKCDEDARDSVAWEVHFLNHPKVVSHRDQGEGDVAFLKEELEKLLALVEERGADAKVPRRKPEAAESKSWKILLNARQALANRGFDGFTVDKLIMLPDRVLKRRLPGIAEKLKARLDNLSTGKSKSDSGRWRDLKHTLARRARLAVRWEQWEKGQEELEKDDDLRESRARPILWPSLDHIRAIGFSLDRPDLSVQRGLLCDMPFKHRGTLQALGAMHLCSEVEKFFFCRCTNCQTVLKFNRVLRCPDCKCLMWGNTELVPILKDEDFLSIPDDRGVVPNRHFWAVFCELGMDVHTGVDTTGNHLNK